MGYWASFDKSVLIPITKQDILKRKRIIWDFDANRRVPVDGEEEDESENGNSSHAVEEGDEDVSGPVFEKPKFGIDVNAEDLAPLLLQESDVERPLKRKRDSGDVAVNRGERRKNFSIKIIGVGPHITGDLRADLNVEFCVDLS
jgi:hypothetical protein